jgi:hypothetical protein
VSRLDGRGDTCILEVDSPSYPPPDVERRQCGCDQCRRDLERARPRMVESRHQEAADNGLDTWEDYRGDR